MFILHDTVTGDRIALKATLRIGRFQGDLKLKDDTQVSKSHCLVETLDDVVRITDLGSTNGTFVNKQRLNAHEPRPLIPGDTVQIGRTVFKLELEDEPSFNIAHHEHSIKLTEDEDEADLSGQDEVTGNIAKTEILSTAQLPPLSEGNKLDLNNPVHLSLTVFVVIKVFLMFSDGSFDFGSKFSPINFILADLIGIIAAVFLLIQPLRVWFHHFPNKVPGVIFAAVILFSLQMFVNTVADQVLGLSQQKQVNRIYTQCLVKKSREMCMKETAKCPTCLEKLSPNETMKIQDFMSQVSDL